MTLDTYRHVVPGMGGAAAGAMDTRPKGWIWVAVRFAVNEVPSLFETSLSTSRSFTFYLQTEEKAERVGFEPTRRFNTAYAISSPKTCLLARSILSAKIADLQGFCGFVDEGLSAAY